MSEITEAEIDGAIARTQAIMDATARMMTSGEYPTQLDQLACSMSSAREALTDNPGNVANINDALAVLMVFYVEEIQRVEQMREPVMLSADAIEQGCELATRAARDTAAYMAEHLAEHPDTPDTEIAAAEFATRFAESMIFLPGDPARHFALSQGLIMVSALIQLAKARNALPGLLEAYGAVRAGASAAYTTGAMEEYAMHTEKAKELAAEITALVSGGN